MRLHTRFGFAGIGLLLLMGAAQAQGPIVWANNASFGSPHLQAYDLSTGAAVADFVAPNRDAQRNKANGRGIAVVGTTLYYSLANSGNVYVTDTVTHADGGVAIATNLPGIAGLFWDGTSLWVLPYVNLSQFDPNSANVYSYSPAGKLQKTVKLIPWIYPNPAVPRDALVVTPTGFVTDRGSSVPYDRYDLNGNLAQKDFITSHFRTTGVAFDGQQFVTSDVFTQQLTTFDINGVVGSTVSLSGAPIPFGLEGLAMAPAGTPVIVPPPPPPPPPVALTALALSPTSVVGGTPVQGTITLNTPALAGGVTVVLTSNNAAAFPANTTITIPAGSNSGTFPVSTTGVTATTTSTISASFNGVTVSADLIVVAPFGLASLTLNPSSLTGGNFGAGTLTLSSPAAGDAIVTLASSNPQAASVPASVTIPAGSSSMSFVVVTQPVNATVTISANLGGVTQSANLTVSAPLRIIDSIFIVKAEYKAPQLKVQVVGTNSQATVTLYVTSSGQLIGTLSNAGGGNYVGQFNVSTNPQNLTAKSSAGGATTGPVAAK